MTVELLLGRPASGKTEACIHKIRRIQSSQPLANIWVLVPDSQNIAYFRRRLADAGGGIGVHIGTFSALYTKILHSRQLFTPVISPALEHRLVQETVYFVHIAGLLRHFAAIKNKPGFILALQDIFSELRAGYISPLQFTEYTQDKPLAKRELALLYAHFLERLQDLDWIDRDGQIWQAINFLKANFNAASDIRFIVVDGFSAFAGARVQFLKLLSQQVGEILITLTGQLDSIRPVHHKSQSEIEQLIQELSPNINQITIDSHLSSECEHLEKFVLEPGECEKKLSRDPIFLEAPSPTEEAREALRWIKALNKRRGVSLDKCAIFVPDLINYRPLLQLGSNEFGIKVRFSHPESLMEAPAIQTIINLLELPIEDYPSRGLINSLRSPYFDFGLEPNEIDVLEWLSRHANIVMGRDQWDETWEMLLQTTAAKDNFFDDEEQFKNLLNEIDIPTLHDHFLRFWDLFEAIDQERSQENWIVWLEKLLNDLSFYDQIESERDQEACSSLADALKALVLSESVVGIRKTDYLTFISDLQSIINGARLEEPRSTRRNTLWIGKMSEARASRFEAVALLGFSEGSFPIVEKPDPFLDEELRRDLGLEPQLEREQASTFYQAFTRANSHLLITRPYLSDDGEKWEPSPYWDSAINCFDKTALKKVSQNARLRQADAASPQELLFLAVQQNHLQFKTDSDLETRWEHLQGARSILNNRRSKIAGGIYEGYTPQIVNNLSERFQSSRPWSASRFETYTTCPFQFYVQYVLDLEAKEPPELGLNPQQIGSIYHRILELVYQEADPDTEISELLISLNEVADRVFQEAPRKYGFRPSSLWEVEKEQMKETLQETLQALYAERHGWTPIAFEQKFGFGPKPPLRLDIGGEEISLRGFIDRVDRHLSDGIRIIDYKTGSSHLADRDFEEGRRLQLPIYALAAQEALQLGKVMEGFYWIIRSATAGSIKLSKYIEDSNENLANIQSILIEHIQSSLSGIRSGIFPPQPPRGGCPSYCPAAAWCWRYQPGW